MKTKIITWIMTMGLVFLMSTVVWADGRHHRGNRPPRGIVSERYHPGAHHPQYRNHPAYHKRWVKQWRRAPRYYVHGYDCDSVYGYRYYEGRPWHDRHRLAGVWIEPGWSISISTGGGW